MKILSVVLMVVVAVFIWYPTGSADRLHHRIDSKGVAHLSKEPPPEDGKLVEIIETQPKPKDVKLQLVTKTVIPAKAGIQTLERIYPQIQRELKYMDSRERTFIALDHQEPDRVPLDCWVSQGTKHKINSKMQLSYDEFLDKYDIDLRYIKGPEYIGPSLKTESGLEKDIWGVSRKPVSVRVSDGTAAFMEVYNEVLESPLKKYCEVEEIFAYPHWPSADWFDYSCIEKQCDEIRDRGRVAVFMGDRLNRFAQLKPAMYLRGMSQIFLDMLESPEIVNSIFQHIISFYIEYENRILEAARGKIDILVTGDDFGMQNGLMISPSMWQDMLEKGFSEYIKVAKDHGAKVMHHTCGSVYGIIEDFIDCDLDILQSVQPEASGMDPGRLKSEFGDRLCFQGGISIQKILPFMNPADVRAHVASVFGQMMPGGGYIAGTAHNIQADTSIENIAALFEAYHVYGGYS